MKNNNIQINIEDLLKEVLKDYPYLHISMSDKKELIAKIKNILLTDGYENTKRNCYRTVKLVIECNLRKKLKEDAKNIIIEYIDYIFKEYNKNLSISVCMELIEEFIEKYDIVLDYELTSEIISESKELKIALNSISSSKESMNLGPISLSFLDAYNLFYSRDDHCDYYGDEKLKLNGPCSSYFFKDHIDILKSNKLTLKEEQAYFKIMEEGTVEEKNLAREKIILHTEKLVISLANRYQNTGISLDDLIQDGNEGLVEALNRFDYKLGYKFSTYATWWIKKFIYKGINEKNRMIRIPVHLLEMANKVRKFSYEFELLHARKPTENEIKEKFQELTIDKIKEINLLPYVQTSLNEPINSSNDQGTEMLDIIADRRTNQIDNLINNIYNEDIIFSLNNIKAIKKRDVEILKYACGFGPREYMSLREIGSEFGITKQRVQQIICETTQKIRKNREFSKHFK